MVIAIIIAVLVAAFDQLSKYLIVASDIATKGDVTVIPGILTFVYSENDGMALGIGSGFRWIYVAVTVIVCGIMFYLMTKNDFRNKLYYVSAGMIVGGGIGNMIDRIFDGYVVDFLSLSLFQLPSISTSPFSVSFYSPICNIADYFITAGTVCLIVFVIFYLGKSKKKTVAPAENIQNDEN